MAIAFDATTSSSRVNATTTLTYAHTCTGSDRFLVVATANNTARTVTSVTYNWVSMTQVLSPLTNSNWSILYLWILANPASWSNNIVVTTSGNCEIISKCISYTGVNASWQPDSSSSTWPTTTTSFTTSTTTVADNCWCVMWWMGMNWSTLTAGANTFVRSQIEVALAGLFMVDTNSAQTPAGSKSVNVTSASQQFHWIMISLSPSGVITFVPKIMIF